MLKRAGRRRGIEAEAERLRDARMIGQLYHCLQHRELFDEQSAFPAPLPAAAAAV
uniref:hypothetical protein n=1 Tax=Streptomyces lunaelactis TaxID=1535768 RepID=UPI0024836EC8|nr:hypothetical protein [Streptomyces lunaelactis]